MTLRTQPHQLHWPSHAPAPSADELTATLALVDAVEMDHEVLAGYALDRGARLDATVTIGDDSPDSLLARAVRRAIWKNTENENGGRTFPQSPFAENVGQIVERLVDVGARAHDALKPFLKDWLLDSGSKPLNHPLVVTVERAGLDAMLHETSPTMFGFDPAAARAPVWGKPNDGWLSIAARHRRADMIEHWFAHGGALNASRLMGFVSPLVAMLEPTPSSLVVPPAHDQATRESLTTVWMNASDDLYRQEALHLVVALTQWRTLLPQQRGKTVHDTPVADAIEHALRHALEIRPIDLHLTLAESESVKTGTRVNLVEEALRDLETAVLRHALRSSVAEPEHHRGRPRL